MTDAYSSGMLSHDSAGERARLGSIQSTVDGFSTGILDGLRIGADWSCLELGAGAGSIARWLAQRCPDGRVTAVDIDTGLLDDAGAPNLDVRRADVTDPGFQPGRFDLIHARFLFCHLPSRDELVARAASWLNPGGWLVITDPYQLPAETSPFPVIRRVMAAYQDSYAQHGADLTWSRQLPSLLAGAGLSTVDFTGKLGCMGNLAGDRWKPLVDQAAPTMLERGTVTQDELDEFAALLADPGFVDIPQFTLAAWAQRPA